jgi:hypothetical protein
MQKWLMDLVGVLCCQIMKHFPFDFDIMGLYMLLITFVFCLLFYVLKLKNLTNNLKHKIFYF